MSPFMSPTVRGALWMLASMSAFAGMNTLVRFLSTDFSAFEQVFFRGVFGGVWYVTWMERGRPDGGH